MKSPTGFQVTQGLSHNPTKSSNTGLGKSEIAQRGLYGLVSMDLELLFNSSFARHACHESFAHCVKRGHRAGRKESHSYRAPDVAWQSGTKLISESDCLDFAMG